jgi:hypothetical protein
MDTRTRKSAAPADWRARSKKAKPAHVVVTESDFAGIRAGSRLLIANPDELATYIAKIPRGETRNLVRLRNELARRHKADATCPVTTSIFLRIVSEIAWSELEAGRAVEDVVPFWRVVEPGSPVAKRLRCDSAWIAHQRDVERTTNA